MAGPPLAVVHFRGHHNVKATNTMTLEVTKDEFLTPRGDCIIGVMSDMGCGDLPHEAKGYLMKDGARVRLVVEVGGESFIFHAYGSSSLTLTHASSMVIRRSAYTCPRTLAIRSTAAACDLPRSIVAKLANGALGALKLYPTDP
jgi:hypothetical protein